MDISKDIVETAPIKRGFFYSQHTLIYVFLIFSFNKTLTKISIIIFK